VPANDENDRGVIEIVEAIIDDTRELVDAHVDSLREEMSDRLSGLGAAITSSLLAFSITIVTALLLGIAIATTLIAVGLPIWAAFWIVTGIGALTGYGLVRRVQRKAKETGKAASDVANLVRENVAQISSQTAQIRSEA
jgi:uncharacterized RDD family membrane protein YckC